VLWAKRHGNKLKTGHLRGNKFTLRIRGVERPDAGLESFSRLVARGLPNAFGAQRFGVKGDNADLGRLLLKGERLPRRPDRFQRKLYLSAIQSELFNQVLARRLSDGTFDRALKGDVLKKSDTGGQFVCEAPEVDQPRVDAFEVSPTGPLFGPKMARPTGEVGALEEAVLAASGLTRDDFKRGGDETQGTRRPLRVRLEDASAERDGEDLVLRFTLPSGSYATCVLDEVVKG
jgi:tRNA pseudouridine13 synthase